MNKDVYSNPENLITVVSTYGNPAMLSVSIKNLNYAAGEGEKYYNTWMSLSEVKDLIKSLQDWVEEKAIKN